MTTKHTQAATAVQALSFGTETDPKPMTLREKVAQVAESVVAAAASALASDPKPEPVERETVKTPYGVLFSDTEAYARYAELRRIRDWLKSFLDDMEHLRLGAPAAVERIDAFCETLGPSHRIDILARIRASLSGNTEIRLGQPLTALRLHASNHWDYAVSCAGQDCERPPRGDEIAYTGPFPRKSGDQTPAFGYSRAMADGRL